MDGTTATVADRAMIARRRVRRSGSARLPVALSGFGCLLFGQSLLFAGGDGAPPVPPLHEEAILTPQPDRVEPRFGLALAVSGSAVLVTSANDGDEGTAGGSVHAFGDSKRGWRRVQRLQSSDPALQDHFGSSIAADGSRLLIGRDGSDDGAQDAGAAVVLRRSGFHYKKEADLVAPDGSANDNFGGSAAVHGSTAIIGASRDDDGGIDSGSAYVWSFRNNAWTLATKLVAPDAGSADWFGHAVAIDENFVVVGAYGDDDRGEKCGAAYVFRREGDGWTLDGKLVPEDLQEGDWFGFSVAISGDRIAVGAPRDDGSGDSAGCVRIFRRGREGWSRESILRPAPGTTTAWFGYAVALTSERLIVGSPGDNTGGDSAGAAMVFARTDGTWTPRVVLLPKSSIAGEQFGASVAIDGDLVAVGRQYDADRNTGSGKAWIFRLAGKSRKETSSDSVKTPAPTPTTERPAVAEPSKGKRPSQMGVGVANGPP